MIDQVYKCDLCKSAHNDGHFDRELIGILWVGTGSEEEIIEKPAINAKYHLCSRCISSIQNFQKRCISGFKCSGGVHCTSDHK